MSVNVQSMLDELREEMTSFEGSLPGISDRDALDGLLGIKHVLLERWKTQERSATDSLPRRSDTPWLLEQWDAQERKAAEGIPRRSDTPWLDTALVVGSIGTMFLALLAILMFGAFGAAAGWTSVGGGLVAVAIAGLLYHRWQSQPEPQPSASTDLPAQNKSRIDEDPVFLIEEVQAYVREQIDTAHERFSEIRMQFEKAVMYPRAKAETALVTLREKRQDAEGRQFPDEDQILAQIDKYIAECERLLNPSFDEERVAKQLRDTGEQLQALYKYPAQLEQVKAAYQSQADFVADLDDVGVDINAIQSSRSTTMMAVASQLRDLRGEIGLTNKLLEGFGGYLAAQPELQHALATGGKVVDAQTDDVAS